MNVIDSTWDFKCKQYPDGLIKKSKARTFCKGWSTVGQNLFICNLCASAAVEKDSIDVDS